MCAEGLGGIGAEHFESGKRIAAAAEQGRYDDAYEAAAVAAVIVGDVDTAHTLARRSVGDDEAQFFLRE